MTRIFRAIPHTQPHPIDLPRHVHHREVQVDPLD